MASECALCGREVFEEWEDDGEEQPGKYTTVNLQTTYLTGAWAGCFSMARHDFWGTDDGEDPPIDLPMILPLNQYAMQWTQMHLNDNVLLA